MFRGSTGLKHNHCLSGLLTQSILSHDAGLNSAINKMWDGSSGRLSSHYILSLARLVVFSGWFGLVSGVLGRGDNGKEHGNYKNNRDYIGVI